MTENPKTTRETKIEYFSKPELVENLRNDYGPEYFEFWAVFAGLAPRTCPKCRSEKIRILYLSVPKWSTAGEIWSKWYLWCESCLNGIYCPPGTYRIPITEPHILWGDEKALKDALPESLHLIKPRSLGSRSTP
jgi:hypothetical protein